MHFGILEPESAEPPSATRGRAASLHHTLGITHLGWTEILSSQPAVEALTTGGGTSGGHQDRHFPWACTEGRFLLEHGVMCVKFCKKDLEVMVVGWAWVGPLTCCGA